MKVLFNAAANWIVKQVTSDVAKKLFREVGKQVAAEIMKMGLKKLSSDDGVAPTPDADPLQPWAEGKIRRKGEKANS